MTGVLVPTGVVTVCCGGHHPAPGEASTCVCCPECVTNAYVARHSPEVRRLVAAWKRSETLPGLLRLRDAYRRVEHALAVAAMWDTERDEVRHFGEALAHAVYLPPAEEFPPVQGVLT